MSHSPSIHALPNFSSGGGSGEANTSSNVGTGEGLAKAKVGVDLPFKSLLGTTNEIDLVGNTNDVTFSLNTLIARINVAKNWTATQTFTVIQEFQNALHLSEIATPTVAGSNQLKYYAKDFNGLAQPYCLSEYGLEQPMTMLGQLRRRYFHLGQGSDLGTATDFDSHGLGTLTSEGTVSNFTATSTFPSLKRWASGAVLDSDGGIFSLAMVRRDMNPVLIFRYRTTLATVKRLWIGWVEADHMASDSTPATHKFALRASTSAGITNICIVHSDGTTESIIDTGVSGGATGMHTVILIADNANARFGWSLDGSAISWVTINIPASTDLLILQAQVRTLEAVAKNLDIDIRGFYED